MSQSPISELLLPYDPGPLTEKTQRRRRAVRGRIVSLVITVAILVALYFWQRDQLEGTGYLPVYAVVLAIPVVWLAVVLIRYLLSRSQLRSIGRGTAIRIGPPGIQVAGLAAPWPYVASVTTSKGGIGRSPALVLRLIDGRQARVPLDQVSVFPATLDSSVRAFSAGRYGVDLAALEN